MAVPVSLSFVRAPAHPGVLEKEVYWKSKNNIVVRTNLIHNIMAITFSIKNFLNCDFSMNSE